MAWQIKGKKLPVPDDRLAAHIIMIHLQRGTEYQGCHGIVQCTGVIELIQLDGDEVGTFAGFERTNIVPVEDRSTADGGEFQRLAGG